MNFCDRERNAPKRRNAQDHSNECYAPASGTRNACRAHELPTYAARLRELERQTAGRTIAERNPEETTRNKRPCQCYTYRTSAPSQDHPPWLANATDVLPHMIQTQRDTPRKRQPVSLDAQRPLTHASPTPTCNTRRTEGQPSADKAPSPIRKTKQPATPTTPTTHGAHCATEPPKQLETHTGRCPQPQQMRQFPK